MTRRMPRRLLVAAAVAGVALTGCSGGSAGVDASVFSLKVGECLVPPTKVTQELSKVRVVPCSQPHTQEAYAVVAYQAPANGDASTYPGDAVLKQYADGACAQRYAGYVGVDYQDSSLFFTYLLPSARSWQQGDDRNVICFVTTTGQQLHSSVKGSRK